MRVALIAAALLALTPAHAFSCSRPSYWNNDRQTEFENEVLLRANFIYRGVVENPRTEERWLPAALTDMRIRRTQLFWGYGAPPLVEISQDDGYYIMCPTGNLHLTTAFGGEPGWPQIRDGLGVTIIGRIGDEAADLLILVDGAPGTQETLRRFATILRNQ